MIADALLSADRWAVADDLLEGLGIHEVPSLHMGVRAGDDQALRQGRTGRSADLLALLGEPGAVPVDADDHQVSRGGLECVRLDQCLVGQELGDSPCVSPAYGCERAR